MGSHTHDFQFPWLFSQSAMSISMCSQQSPAEPHLTECITQRPDPGMQVSLQRSQLLPPFTKVGNGAWQERKCLLLLASDMACIQE